MRVPAARIQLVREPGVAYHDQRRAASTPEAAAAIATQLLALEPAEAMGAIYLTTRNRVLSTAVLYRGTIDRAVVEPRGFLQAALLQAAASMILCHVHPSGDPSPSAADLEVTRRMVEAGEVVGVRVLDHIIVGALTGDWESLARRGMIS